MAIENQESLCNALSQRLTEIGSYLHIEDKRSQLEALEAETTQPGFWDDQKTAQKIAKQASDLRDEIQDYEDAWSTLEDAQVGNELACAGEDEELAAEVAASLEALTQHLDALELSSWFTGEFDHGDAIVSINPGAGGNEANDWADMLFKMYLHYANRKGWKTEVLDAPPAEVLGIERATFTVSGRNAYGMLRSEDGVHRLVRISPTDDKKRRHTTFAAVQVLPVIPDDVEVEINPSDLRIDVYRASGPGGQCVNTTDSAVRITHIPTGTVVTCQDRKSQLQNKEAAMRILKARLYEIEQRKRQEELDELRGDKRHIEFGSQIRNYVLYPYQLVKDVRSEEETGNVDGVLNDGDLDSFVIAYHRWRVSQN